MKSPRSRSLIALSSTALALPGIAGADAPPTQNTLSYKLSNYVEDDLSRHEVLFGELERYDIDIHQFQLIAPLGRNSALQVDANYESLSGASPWFTSQGPNGSPVVNLSGASGIRDRRTEFAIGGSYYLENGKLGGNVGYSEEDDYRSRYIGLNAERQFNNAMTTLALGFSFADDSISPTDAALFNRVRSEDKQTASVFFSASQILNQFTTVQTALGITQHSGYLSDPYKLIDVRPDQKTQLAWTNSLRHFFVAANAAWHINYRYYHDDFGISSHTFDMAWQQNLGRDFRVVPAIRYYSQSAANFFTNIDNPLTPATAYQSSDYRLSAFGAISGSLSLVADLGAWSTTLTAERYMANEKYSAYTVTQPSTALVKYFRVSLGVEFSF